jgi:cobalamin biosynthesis protein CbiD
VSQILAVFSSEEVAMRVPSGEKVAAVTGPVWPARVLSGLAVAVSQILAVLSSEEVAIRVPSGEKVAAVTGPV